MSPARFAWGGPHKSSVTAIVPNQASTACATRRRPAVHKCRQDTTGDATHPNWSKDCVEGPALGTLPTQTKRPPAARMPPNTDSVRKTVCSWRNTEQEIPDVQRETPKVDEDRSPTPKRVRRCVLCTETVPKAKGLEMDKDNSVVERFVRYRPENDARWYCHATCLRRCIHDGGVVEAFLRSTPLKRASSRYVFPQSPRVGSMDHGGPHASTRGTAGSGALSDEYPPERYSYHAEELIVKGRQWGLRKERQLLRTYQVACAKKNAADALRVKHLAAKLPRLFEMWKEGWLICHLERRRELTRRQELRRCLSRFCAVIEREQLALAVAAWEEAPDIRKQVDAPCCDSAKPRRSSLVAERESILIAQKRAVLIGELATKTQIDFWMLDRAQELFHRFEDTSTYMLAQDKFPALLMKLMRAKDNAEIPDARVQSCWRSIDPKGAGAVDFNSFAVWLARNHRLVALK